MAQAKRPVAVDLFAGVGGLSLGLEQAGFDIAAAVEFDPIHAATHELNFPDTPVICESVRDLTGCEIRARAGLGNRTVDALVGGPPCQGFSLIGHRVLSDPRNDLVFHFLRLVEELRPRTFVMENVPGMATGGHTALLSELISRFQQAGYKVRTPYQILNAANYGVPQNRRRLFLLGARQDTKLPSYPQALTRILGKENEPTNLPVAPSVGDALSDMPGIEEYPELFSSDRIKVSLRGGTSYARTLRGEQADETDFSYSRERSNALLTGCGRAKHSTLSKSRFRSTTPGETEPISRFFRLPKDGLCNTLRAGTASDRGAFSAPRPIHPEKPRCISVREAARLHSYPDWFQFHSTIWHGFRQIGNSVPPRLGRAVGRSLVEALGVRPEKPKNSLKMVSEEKAFMNMRDAEKYFRLDHRPISQRRRLDPQVAATL